MESKLFDLAREGDAASLKMLLLQDPMLLNRSMVLPYVSETALHVAATLGHLHFVREILVHKPELAKEVNSTKLTPLHLAAAKGHIEVVKALILADPEMCTVRDINGLTPLHFAAVKGRCQVLNELIHSIVLVDLMATDEQQLGETILHMCVKRGKLDCLKIVLEMAGDDGGMDFVNRKDSYGNTILHLALIDKQYEVNFIYLILQIFN